MKKTIIRNEKNKKHLNMIIDGKLKDPPPSVIKKISAELSLDIPVKK